MALEDVARVLGCPVGTVKSRIFRAKERLRGLLQDYTNK
jgi:DNA-directed RNA polymerase specialized sigma24 family protein